MVRKNSDIRDLVTQLRRMQSHIKLLNNPKEILRRVNKTIASEKMLTKVIQKRFETEGRSQNEAWKELAKATAISRAKLGFSARHPILQRSGILLKAATSKEVGDETGLRLMFKDGSAPKYVGRGKATRSKQNGMLSDYAEALNKVRPFYGQITKEEAVPIIRRRNTLIQQVLESIATGTSINTFLKR